MAIKLNLLPPGYGISGGLVKFLKTARMLGVIGLAFFLVFTLGISAFFILSTLTLRNLNSDVDTLKAQITAINPSEQQIVLLKDRLDKIKTVMEVPSAIKNLDLVSPFISNLSPNTTLKALNVNDQEADFLIQFSLSSDVSAFLKSLSDSTAFVSVVITSFKFSPVDGYLVNVAMVSK